MSASIGVRIRRVRTNWGLSLRDVEQRSVRLAQELGDPGYQISASWLARIEKEEHELTATKLMALASIYCLSYDQVLGPPRPTNDSLCIPKAMNAPNSTVALEAQTIEEDTKTALLQPQEGSRLPEQTTLLPSLSGPSPTPYRRAILGRLDRSLDPMIRAGSILEVHTQKRAILPRRGWSHEFDRPIYLLLSHAGYACGWCELDPDSIWLTLIPHPLSHANSQRWRFRKEVEVIGQVVAVHMRLDSNTQRDAAQPR